jgi:hypothetical protein
MKAVILSLAFDLTGVHVRTLLLGALGLDLSGRRLLHISINKLVGASPIEFIIALPDLAP